jgi:hydroxymethylglutaryl-CoA lyase
MSEAVEIVEVGPRDGFQSIAPFVPTEVKIALIERLHRAGLRRMETTSFVSQRALPQLADAADIVSAVAGHSGLDAQVLVPTERQAAHALAAGVRHISFVLSVTEAHNRANVRRAPADSAAEYARIVAALPEGARVRLNLATAFDCPFRGPVAADDTLALLEGLVAVSHRVEIALCDTTGRVGPRQVTALFAAAMARFPEVEGWAFHAHDTFGLGAVNVLAAWEAGIRVFDASVAGLGGCPFAPGATGNVATEDLVWLFETMGVATGIDLGALADIGMDVARLPGACTGGRVRQALAGRRKLHARNPS